MTQKEAVKRILDFLPQEAFMFKNQRINNVLSIWCSVFDSYCLWQESDSKSYFHFSSVRCDRPEFHTRKCLCFTVGKNNHITRFEEHLPNHGTGKGCR